MCLRMLGSLKEGIIGTSEFQGISWGEESKPREQQATPAACQPPGISPPAPDLAHASYAQPGGSAQPTHPDLNSLPLGLGLTFLHEAIHKSQGHRVCSDTRALEGT